MPTIRATCDHCGDVLLTVEDLTVQIEGPIGGGRYLFQCPQCRVQVSRPASERTIDLLITAGVRCQRAFDVELLERRPDLGPITVDDLIDFHLALADDRRLEDELRRLRI